MENCSFLFLNDIECFLSIQWIFELFFEPLNFVRKHAITFLATRSKYYTNEEVTLSIFQFNFPEKDDQEAQKIDAFFDNLEFS